MVQNWPNSCLKILKLGQKMLKKSYYIGINPTWTKVQIETQIRKIVFSKRIRGIWVVFHEIPVVLQLLLSPGKKLENNSFTYFPYPYIYNTAQLIRLVHNFFARFFFWLKTLLACKKSRKSREKYFVMLSAFLLERFYQDVP